jgi:predicted TIM-barrel fold metal-dependent hydrolase
VAPVLEAHATAAEGRLRGIRYLTARDESFRGGIAPPPPAQIMGSPAFRQGYKQLQRFGLSYDAWLYHTQIDELTELARSFPDTQVILNHVGGALGVGAYAGKRQEVFPIWQAAIRRLAECPNAFVKLGGLAMVVTGFAFHEQPLPPDSVALLTAWQPYIDTCIEAFGTNRCMFESNFPVDKAMCSYVALWNAFKRAAAGHSASDKAALFHDTAAKVYRLSR